MSNRSSKKPLGAPIATQSVSAGQFNLGLLELDLALDPNFAFTLDLWRISEAFRRGASSTQVYFLFMRSRQSSQQAVKSHRSQSFDLGQISVDSELEYQDFLVSFINQAEMAYRHEMWVEFSGLPNDVQHAFAFKDGTPFYHYLRMRPAYYNAGYDNPAKTIFSCIRSAQLAGREVAGGAHEALAKKLPDVDKLLDQWRPNLPRLSVEIGKHLSIGGFVPRYIAPRQGQKHPPSLSNHGLGLAIDIDPGNNPHIKDHDAIKTLNEIAKPSGIDYGNKIVDPGGLPPEDWAAQTWRRAQEASDLIKAWLTKYLPVYDAQKQRSQLEQQISHAKNLNEKNKLMDKLSGGDPSKAVTPALTPDETDAIQKIKTLLRFHLHSDLKTWAAHGIQTIPQLLAVALVKSGFRWGQCYITTKDAMHFELVDKKGKAVVSPESSPRTVDDLFPVAQKPEMHRHKKSKSAAARQK
ncbi:MAG TPA: hypothetical protein VME24_04540 [Alphaproteobacteria bacterium]|nr:hypothetical protein [Alphaproteobacteria bacterium]